MPRKEVILNPIGMAMSWGHTAALGFLAREAKSGALVISVNMLLYVSSRSGIAQRDSLEAARDADEHLPVQVRSRKLGGLREDRPNTARAGDGPPEQREANDGADDCLAHEEPSELVDGNPDGREGEEPVDEEGENVGWLSARV